MSHDVVYDTWESAREYEIPFQIPVVDSCIWCQSISQGP